jgi:hypothetical protein
MASRKHWLKLHKVARRMQRAKKLQAAHSPHRDGAASPNVICAADLALRLQSPSYANKNLQVWQEYAR